jgi:sigma-B regulation protein RsbU (phosphoserine phosphatase)
MRNPKHTWQEELEIIDRTMKAISGVNDPEELVNVYWNGIDELISVGEYVALSRRNVEPPYYLITRSSRFTEHPNPWTQRDQLPKLTGGLLGEFAYANKPVIIDDLPARLKPDDPGWFYLQGFAGLIALPQYDHGEGLNVTVMLMKTGLEIDHSMIPILHWQAGLFGRGTTNLILRNQLAAALKSLDRELQAVGDIQRWLLPQRLPTIPGFELAAYYETSARAGGDYYDFFPLTGGRWGLFIADVSGHGTPAAVLMAITHTLAHAQPGSHTPPAVLLTYLNDHLLRSYTREGTFVTAFYAVLDPAARTITYASGGHNPPRLARDRRVISLDEAGALPLGIEKAVHYDEATLAIEAGDMLLLYTDGITEAMAPSAIPGSHDLFGVERLDEILLKNRGQTSEQCLAQIRAEVSAYSGNALPTDDRTLVALRCI